MMMKVKLKIPLKKMKWSEVANLDYKCKLCNYGVNSKILLKVHMTTEHGMKYDAKQLLLENKRIEDKNSEIAILKKKNESLKVTLVVKEQLVVAKETEIENIRIEK